MIKVKEVFVLEEAVADLNEGKAFYDRIDPGIGNYFRDCLVSDFESLVGGFPESWYICMIVLHKQT